MISLPSYYNVDSTETESNSESESEKMDSDSSQIVDSSVTSLETIHSLVS